MNAYSTSKAAVFMFGDCLRAELDQAGVGLTTVCHGVIDTNIVHTTRFDVPAAKQAKVEARRAQIEKAFAARRYGPEKVAKAIVSAVKKKQADPARDAGGVFRLRRRPSTAAGDARFCARERDVVQPFWAMSSRTANMVRVGTPVPPLPV